MMRSSRERPGRAGRAQETLGRRIEAARVARGISQAALARAMSLDRTAVSRIESGLRTVGAVELSRIARVLDRPIDWFLREGPESPEQLLGWLRRRRAAILRICAKHGARSVRVFGSVARGDAGPTSDIDFLVDIEPGRSLLDHGALLVELEELLGRPVDVVPEDALRERLRATALREAVPL